jgi:hypothetical protein
MINEIERFTAIPPVVYEEINCTPPLNLAANEAAAELT